MSSASVPELVSVAYERSDDAPTQLSILMWMSLRVTRAFVPLNVFLSTGTLITSPGLGSTSIWPWIGKTIEELIPSTPVLLNVRAPLVEPLAMPIEPFSLILSIATPQPIWYPASSVPPFTDPVVVPVNVPPTSQSRDESAVVSGGTGSWVSLLPTTVNVRPSGVCAMPGTSEGTAPLSGGGPGGGASGSPAGAAAGSGGGGSAIASGAVPTGTSRQTAARVAKRFNMSRWRLSSSESHGICPWNNLWVGCPNGKRTDNSSRPTPIHWASTIPRETAKGGPPDCGGRAPHHSTSRQAGKRSRRPAARLQIHCSTA